MFGFVAAGGLIALIVLMVQKKATKEEVQKSVKNFVQDSLGSASPEELQEVARHAVMGGLSRTAETLKAKADALAKLPPSPIPEANALGWRKFIKIIGTNSPSTLTPDARYGTFAFGARRLQDLGLVANVSMGTYKGKQVWTGEWNPPMTGAKFLADYRIQYNTFVVSCRNFRDAWLKLRQTRPELFASLRVGGKPLTLSGWLALTHKAGLAGAVSFLSDQKKRIPRTVAVVKKSNGIF